MSHSLPRTGIPSVAGLTSDGILGPGPILALTGLDIDESGDDGGWRIVAYGIFPLHQGVEFQLEEPGVPYTALCYSGIPGQENVAQSSDGGTAAFVHPPVPLGVYDVVATTEDGLWTARLTDALTIVKRSYTTRLYGLRAHHPPPRRVGPYSIRDERE